MTGDLIFYAFALLTVISGCFVVFSRNIVHAAFSLLFTLFGVAGLYAVLGADFLAVTQVVVYIGGILVLVLFAVMMTRLPRQRVPWRGFDRYVPAGIFSVGILAVLYLVITKSEWPVTAREAPTPTASQIGVTFMTAYIFPFEYVSLVLLVAMIGAAILIRERKMKHEDIAAAVERNEADDEPAETEEVHS